MKGQGNIEYIVSMVIFVIIVIYISFQVANNIPFYHSNSVENRLKSNCIRITETMIKNTDSNYGFAEKPYELNDTKIYLFGQMCSVDSNYENVLSDYFKLSNTSDFQLSVEVNSTLNFICGVDFLPTQSVSTSMERYATTDGQTTKIKLTLW